MISGVGLVLQFVVLEGVIKPGMKTEFKGITFKAGDRLIAYNDAREAKKALDLVYNEGIEYRYVSEAKKEDGIIQATFPNAPTNSPEILVENKEGIFIFTDTEINSTT